MLKIKFSSIKAEKISKCNPNHIFAFKAYVSAIENIVHRVMIVNYQ